MTDSEQAILQKTTNLKVLYDGECPMCRMEIDHIKGLANKNPECGLSFVDITGNTEESTAYANIQQDLLARFHVEFGDGSKIDGARAFVAMWERLPGWRWLAKLSKIPGMLAIMELSYSGFLKIRPFIQSLIRQRIR